MPVALPSGTVAAIFARRPVEGETVAILASAHARAAAGQLTDVAIIGRVRGSGEMFFSHSDWRDRAELSSWLHSFADKIDAGETV